jgi:hypothetical protein
MKRGPVYEAQRFPALIVKAAANDARGSCKTFCLQMAQQGMNALGPRTRLAVNNVTYADNSRTSATGQRNFRRSPRVAGNGCSRFSLMRLVPVMCCMGINLNWHL